MFFRKVSRCLNSGCLLKSGLNDYKGVGSSRKISIFSSLQEKWQLMSAALVERPPVITQEKTKLEREFSDLLHTIEKECSLLSDHELRHLEDQKMADKKNIDVENEKVLITAQEIEDAWQDEFDAFQFASRLTEADAKKDLKSLERKLDKKLILLVEQKLGNSKRWVLPMGLLEENESMRQAAERILTNYYGPEFKAEFIGNSPCGFFQYKYPPNTRKDYVGAKIFFFKAHYISGQMVLKEESPDYKWVARNEIRSLTTTSYGTKLKKMIYE